MRERGVGGEEWRVERVNWHTLTYFETCIARMVVLFLAKREWERDTSTRPSRDWAVREGDQLVNWADLECFSRNFSIDEKLVGIVIIAS